MSIVIPVQLQIITLETNKTHLVENNFTQKYFDVQFNVPDIKLLGKSCNPRLFTTIFIC